jgi:hypothetical protein
MPCVPYLASLIFDREQPLSTYSHKKKAAATLPLPSQIDLVIVRETYRDDGRSQSTTGASGTKYAVMGHKNLKHYEATVRFTDGTLLKTDFVWLSPEPPGSDLITNLFAKSPHRFQKVH